MDLSYKDFNRLLTNLQNTADMLEWSTGAGIPAVDQAYENCRKSVLILRSYTDVDPESTTLEQLQLEFPELISDDDY